MRKSHAASGDVLSSEAIFVPLDTLAIPPKSNRRLIDNVSIPATCSVAVSRTLDSHPFVPSGQFAPSHRILFIGRSAQSEARCRTSPHQTPLRASNDRCGAQHNLSLVFSTRPSRHVYAANAATVSNRFPPVSWPPPPVRSSHRTLSHAIVEVLQCGVFADCFHGSLDQNPTQPRQALPCDRALVTVAARLMNPRRKTRVRANLLRRAKPLHFAKFRHDQQRRVKADAVNVADRLRLRKVRPTLFQLFVESRDLMVVMPQSREQLIADHVADQPKILAAEPRQSAWAEGRFVGRNEVLSCQHVPQLDFRFRAVLGQFARHRVRSRSR